MGEKHVDKKGICSYGMVLSYLDLVIVVLGSFSELKVLMRFYISFCFSLFVKV